MARPVEDVELPRSVHGPIAARLDGPPRGREGTQAPGRRRRRAAIFNRVGRPTPGSPAWTVQQVSRRRAFARLRVKELARFRHEPSSLPTSTSSRSATTCIRDGAYDSPPGAPRRQARPASRRWAAAARRRPRRFATAELTATHLPRGPRRYLDELGVTGDERIAIDAEGYRDTRCAAGDRTGRALATRGVRRGAGIAKRWGWRSPPGRPPPIAPPSRIGMTAVGLGTELRPGTTRAPLGSPSTSPRRSGTRRTRAGHRHSSGSRCSSKGRTRRLVAVWRPGGGDRSDSEPLGRKSEALCRRVAAVARATPGPTRTPDIEGEPIVRRALAMGERMHAPAAVANATQTLAMTLSQQGRSEEAVETMEEAYRLAKDAGDVSVLLRVYNNFSSIVSTFGSDHRRALDVLHEGIELAERSGADGYLAWFLGTLSDITTELGDLEEAERIERESVALAEEVGDEPLRGIQLNGLAWIPSPSEAGWTRRRSFSVGRSRSSERTPSRRPTCTSSRPKERSHSSGDAWRKRSSISGEGSRCRGDIRSTKRRCSSTSWFGCSSWTGDRAGAEGCPRSVRGRPGARDQGVRRRDRRASGCGSDRAIELPAVRGGRVRAPGAAHHGGARADRPG